MDFQLLANLNILNILITLKGVRTVPSMLSTNEKDISKILIRTIRQSSLVKGVIEVLFQAHSYHFYQHFNEEKSTEEYVSYFNLSIFLDTNRIAVKTHQQSVGYDGALDAGC